MADQLPALLQKKLGDVRKMLEAMKPQMMMVLADPRHVDTITRVALTSIQRNPALLDCDPRSLMGAVMQAAQLGLEPDDVRGLAYLVPYAKRVQLIPGYGGILFLALQTEGVRDIYARLVHAGDDFEVDYGADTIVHKPMRGGQNGDVIAGYYMIVYDTGYRRFGGGRDGGIMWREELDEIKAQALANKKNPDQADLPWNARWEQMCWKTLIRRAGKGLPKNSRLATAIHIDELAERGQPQNLELLVDPNALAEATEKVAAEPAQAPRKSDKKEPKEPPPEPSVVVHRDGTQVTLPPAPPPPQENGSLFGTGKPDDKITPATLERVVDKMNRWDKEHGSKVAMAAMKDRYGLAAVTALTEQQAREWIDAINASLGLPAGE